MREQVSTILNRLEADVAALRASLGKAPAKAAKNVGVPTLKESYTRKAAESEKARIDAAFAAGLITYDKKRGLKMLVTKATQGWSPVK